MKKLLFIASVLLSSFAFTACEEEIITPNTETTTTEGTSGNGGSKDDEGQWD